MSTPNEKRWVSKLAALDANLLVALDALLQESNVTRAAKRLGVTQSAMSQTLARLRQQFDDPILVQVGRGMEPSAFALRIQARLHDAISQLATIVGDRPTFDETTASRRFVLAMVDYLSLVLFPELHATVTARAPGVDLAVRTLESASIAPDLQRAAVDLYVGVIGPTERALEVRTLFSDRMRVLVRRGHALCSEMSLRAYADGAHVLVSPRRESGSVVTRELAALGHGRRIATEVPYFSLLPKLLLHSELVATVPERVAQLFVAEHPLEVLDPPLRLPEVDVCMAWHPAFSSDPGQIWLRDVVASVCHEL